MTKNQKRILLVTIIVLAAFSTIAFALPFKMNGLFWISYIFAVFAILSQLYIFKVAFTGIYTVKSKFYGFPIAKIGITYMVIQLTLSIIFMVLDSLVPVWIAVVLYVVLLAGTAIGFISTDAMRDEIERQDTRLETNVACMSVLRSIVYSLPEKCDDEKIKNELKKIADEFKYSDPVSAPSLKDVETELENIVGELQNAVIENDLSSIHKLTSKVSNVLSERNRLCKLNKKSKC